MINNNKPELKTGKGKMKEKLFACPQLGGEVKSLIRQLDSKNDLTFLRVRITAYEILIYHLIKIIICVYFTKIFKKLNNKIIK